MSKWKRPHKGHWKPIFPKVPFPSDGLTLGQLRANWPDPEELAVIVRAVRIMEENVAHLAVVPNGAEIASDPLIKPDVDADIRDLTNFYVHTGLASGTHAARLLIQGIEDQARHLYPQRGR